MVSIILPPAWGSQREAPMGWWKAACMLAAESLLLDTLLGGAAHFEYPAAGLESAVYTGST